MHPATTLAVLAFPIAPSNLWQAFKGRHFGVTMKAILAGNPNDDPWRDNRGTVHYDDRSEIRSNSPWSDRAALLNLATLQRAHSGADGSEREIGDGNRRQIFRDAWRFRSLF